MFGCRFGPVDKVSSWLGRCLKLYVEKHSSQGVIANLLGHAAVSCAAEDHFTIVEVTS